MYWWQARVNSYFKKDSEKLEKNLSVFMMTLIYEEGLEEQANQILDAKLPYITQFTRQSKVLLNWRPEQPS